MLPSLLSEQIRTGLDAYLKSTFSLAEGPFRRMLYAWLDSGEGIKGPYFSLGLPFRPGAAGRWFNELKLDFPPHRHQEKAWERLAPEDGAPRSTLVATGTGSGKTECFLYPIFAHCLKTLREGQKGVKAVLIYPMNALATDQASRIASFIARRSNMAGIRAGLYVGGLESEPSPVMSARSVITDRKTMREDPPDILITNYKMLDLLLQRTEDKPLWRFNAPETLRFLVVDELHTFDGAQGTDLACLIRRLKDRLGSQGGTLCCVGTSATMGSGPDALQQMLAYAGSIFGESFDEESVVREDRLSPSEFLGAEPDFVYSDSPSVLEQLVPEKKENREAYLCRQYAAWFGEKASVEDFTGKAFLQGLGAKLRAHIQFRNAVRQIGGEAVPVQELEMRLFRREDELSRAKLNSLFALISAARNEHGGPLLQMRAQLWLRELSGVVASVEKQPALYFQGDVHDERSRACLPVAYCRECGIAGWATTTDINGAELRTDAKELYQAFFSDTPSYDLLFPDLTREQTGGKAGVMEHVCGNCRTIARHVGEDGRCTKCGTEKPVRVLHMKAAEAKKCPCCGARTPWILLGSRAASLTSAVISTLTGSRLNSDKKIITFSDNVQDAAHRAGFYGARTYGPTIRTAMLQCLREQEEKPALAEFAGIFERYWMERLRTQQEYVALFLPPSMEWLGEFEEMKSRPAADGTAGEALWGMLRKRLDWDMYGAFTYLGGLGRTLEKIGAAVGFIPSHEIRQAAEKLRLLAENKIDRLRGCGTEEYALFLAGFLRHLRCLGAVFHNSKLSVYVRNEGNVFAMGMGRNGDPWMPAASSRAKVPFFLCEQVWKDPFEPIYQSDGKTWCLRWAQKVFGRYLAMLGGNESAELYDLGIGILKKDGMLDEEEPLKEHRIWGLSGNALRLSGRVRRLRCAHCGRTITVDEDEAPLWKDAPCVRETCSGRYESLEEAPGFYEELYGSGDLHRLFTAEHTGLLERDEREVTEQSFKREEGRKPWDHNLLSCTPTLEMGIDIGTLSTTIQCSVPPAQANYLQRIGRAGRKNGNALSVTVAGSEPHDQYFFARPELMMSGSVDPPGVFLNASAVLERQLTAYCIDRWVAEGEGTGMPHSMEDVLKVQANVRKNRIEESELPRHFPYDLLGFIRNNATELYGAFTAMFPGLLPETADYLKTFIMGGDMLGQTPLAHKLVDAIAREENETSSYRSRRSKLLQERQKIRKAVEAGLADEKKNSDLDELSREISALTELYKKMISRSPFEFLADESFLPNYAFPEQGVTLHSVVYKKRTAPAAGGSPYSTRAFTYHRSAASALRELVPGCDFYAGKRKVTITKVDLAAGAEQGRDSIEPWRMCPECSYMELKDSAAGTGPCPRCGSPLFADSGQVRNLLRVSQVFANTPDRESRVDDSAENRSLSIYVTQLLLDYDQSDCVRSCRLDTEETTFAFAYIRKVRFREINFGEPSAADPITIAGVSKPRKGFKVCRHCGCVKTGGKATHDWGCKGAGKPEAETFIDCLYLYRQFESEAVKILLPFSDGERSSKLESFIAAFSMGMKLKFGGALQHLQTTLHTEPDPLGGGLRRQFLVVYDAVPGGTGYLKQLLQGTALIDILEIALRHLEQCDCDGAKGNDGCYRCLLAYRNSARSSLISKHSAVDTLRPIVRNKSTQKEISDLDSVSVTSNFESELEAQFLEAVRRMGTAKRPVSLKNELVHGKTGFFLSVGEQRWIIEQQVEIGQEQGVCVPCRADFVFYPAKTREGARPVVIFTDGWQWHRDRLGKDMEQRSALVSSGRYLVWSLTWADVGRVLGQKVSNSVPGDVPEYAEPAWNDKAQAIADKLTASQEFAADKTARRITGKDSMLLLIEYLADPDDDKYRRLATMYALMYAPLHQTRPEAYREGTATIPLDLEYWYLPDDMKMQAMVRRENDKYFTGFYTAFGGKDLKAGALLCFSEEKMDDEDAFKRSWRGLLRAANLFQFLPRFAAYSSSGSSVSYACMAEGAQTSEMRQGKTWAGSRGAQEEEKWRQASELLFLEGEKEFFLLIHDRGLDLPEVGYEVTGASGKVACELELAWPGRKIGLSALDDPDAVLGASELGWTILPYDQVVKVPDTLFALMGA